MSKESPGKNLGLELLRVTESAALAAARWLGKGDKEAGDGAAVDAMRLSFNTIDIDGRVVIGEGEKDEAPMLFNGEELGTGHGPKVDVAVDPVEGTRLLAFGRPNAISVISIAPRNAMFDPGPAFYMKKLVVGHQAKDAIDIDAPVTDNLRKVAQALDKKMEDLVVFVLEKPRHEQLIKEIRSAGARIQLHTDGDVSGAIMAVTKESPVDVMYGTGGTPEGVLAATAIKILGGQIFGKLDPQSDAEKKALINDGYDLQQVYDVDSLIMSDDIYFAATGITDADFVKGADFTGHGAVTHSVVMRGKTGTVRYIEAYHNFDKLMEISAIPYE